MCEAAGMAAQLFQVTEKYSVAVLSGGGFDSTSDKHRLENWAYEDPPVCVLRVGDYDASGASMHTVLLEDVGAFARHYGGDVELSKSRSPLSRLALAGCPQRRPKSPIIGRGTLPTPRPGRPRRSIQTTSPPSSKPPSSPGSTGRSTTPCGRGRRHPSPTHCSVQLRRALIAEPHAAAAVLSPRLLKGALVFRRTAALVPLHGDYDSLSEGLG